MSNIVFFSIPLFGHVNYGLKIARKLSEQGHNVCYYSGVAYKEYIESKYVRFEKYSEDIENLFSDSNSTYNNDYMRHVQAEKLDHIMELYKFSHHLYSILEIFMKKDIHNMKRPDLIIYDSAAIWGRFVAKYFKIPCIGSCTPYSYPLEYAKYDYQKFSKLVFHREMTVSKTERTLYIMNKFLQKSFPDIPDCTVLEPLFSQADYNLIYTSPNFQMGTEFINEDKTCFCGILISDDEAETNYGDLLHEGVNIYIAFGTIYNNEQIFKKIIEACIDLQYNFILNIGNVISSEQFSDLPKNWKIVKKIDQLSMLKCCNLFVSHGGTNSIREAMHYGVPTIVIPTEGDTLCTADDIETHKVGKLLTVDNVSEIKNAICDILSDKVIKENCNKLSLDMKSRCGLSGVINIINSFI